MAWFRLEGKGAFHRKVIAAGNEAYGAWCRAGQWSVEHLTDGFIPTDVAKQIAGEKKWRQIWRILLDASLVSMTQDGYHIHDFLEYNPSSAGERARMEAISEARRNAGKIGGKRSAEARAGQANVQAKPKQNPSKTQATISSKRLPVASDVVKQKSSSDSDPERSRSEPEVEAVENPNARALYSAASVVGVSQDPITTEPPSSPIVASSSAEATHAAKGHDRHAGTVAAAPETGIASGGIDRPTSICSPDDVKVLLGTFPVFGGVTGDPRLLEALLGVVMAHGLTVPRFIETAKEFLAKNSGSATEWTPKLIADRFGAYLAQAKRIGRRVVEASDGECGAVIKLFDELWASAHKGNHRGGDVDDAAHAAALLGLAKEAAGKCGVAPMEVLRHVFAQYLDDHLPFVADALHPMRLLPKRFSTYTLPRREQSRTPRKPEPERKLMTLEEVRASRGQLHAALDAAGAQYTRSAIPVARRSGEGQ